jgi:hypothetical protein
LDPKYSDVMQKGCLKRMPGRRRTTRRRLVPRRRPPDGQTDPRTVGE